MFCRRVVYSPFLQNSLFGRTGSNRVADPRPRGNGFRAAARSGTPFAGIQVNPILRVDPALGNVRLQDKIGAGASFPAPRSYDTRLRIEKITEQIT